MIRCPLCRKENAPGHRYCVRCAKDLGGAGGGAGPAPRYDVSAPCANCGAGNDTNHQFCHACGVPLAGIPSEGRRESELATAGGGQAELLHITPDGKTAAYPVDGAVVIGRAEGDIRFPDDPRMSRTHAVLRDDVDRTMLEDLGSTNGTFVRIRGEVELRPGDVILLGDQLFEYRV